MDDRIVNLAVVQAERVSEKAMDGWDEDRDALFVEPEGIQVLQAGGAKVDYVNHDNGDGTFSHQVVFRGKTFVASSTTELTFL